MFLYGIGALLLFINAIKYLGMARKKDNPSERLINRAFGIYFIGITIHYSLLVLFFLSLEGYPVDHSYWGNLEFGNISLVSKWLWRGLWMIWYISTAVFVYAGEKIRNKKIPVGLIFGFIGFFTEFFIPSEMYLLVSNFPFLIMSFYYYHMLFMLMK